MLWKTSWLGQEPAETRPCLGPATEPPLQQSEEPTCGEGEGAHFQVFFWGWKVRCGGCACQVSVGLGPELGRRWGRSGHVSAPQNHPGSFRIKCICILRSVLPTSAFQRDFSGPSGEWPQLTPGPAAKKGVGEKGWEGQMQCCFGSRCFPPLHGGIEL